jgi:hypothetical protein
LASQLARRAASRSKASSLDSGSLELVEESEAVVVAEPVVPDIEGSRVYLDKELPATRETSADIGLGDVMAPGGDAGADAGDGEIGRRKLDKVKDGPVARF